MEGATMFFCSPHEPCVYLLKQPVVKILPW